MAYVCLACEKKKKKKQPQKKKELTNVKVTSSEPSSHRFTFEALTLVKNGDTQTRMWRNWKKKIQFSSSSSVRAAVLFPVLGSPALYSRCAETLAVRTLPAASLSRGLHGYLVKRADPNVSGPATGLDFKIKAQDVLGGKKQNNPAAYRTINAANTYLKNWMYYGLSVTAEITALIITASKKKMGKSSFLI